MAVSGPDTNSVADYFSRRAAEYHGDSVRWPWSWLRARETGAVIRLLGAVERADVLEFGCGAGYYTRILLQRGAGHVFATDMVADMVAQLPGDGVTAVVSDAAAVSFDRRFGYILIAGLLEFLPRPEEVLANARRHAAPGATLVILAPLANSWGRLYRCFHRRHGVEVNLFAAKALSAAAAAAGWRVADSIRVWPFSLVLRLHPAEAP